ncbi:hypothetical protein [Actinokineospora diospyrosa]|uniref:Uncharacterized protein n=1 Tax=Actinokineospora diospyrosa TaxID=103728 RepID=A0ABT1IFU9_9PSEU|nr:hypothetical protein [Actinokineospora diospyrosa]MCP2271526.1 hypothetical protein [Actinokineospora diospyrosa]
MTGIAVTQGVDRWWAWAASRVRAATAQTAPPTAPPHLAGVHNQQSGPAQTVVQTGQLLGGVHIHHGEATAPDNSAWLRASWSVLGTAPMEVRYLNRPGEGRLDCYLLTRAEGRTRAEAEQRAATVRDHLGDIPGTATTGVTEDVEIHDVLRPFPPPGDVVELRKRLTARRSSRDDAQHPWLTTVSPLRHQRNSWEPLWSALAAQPSRVLLSIGLAPYAVGPGLKAHLGARAAELAKLAAPGPPTTAVWGGARQPDPFAPIARDAILDAAHRYTDRAFVVRISLAGAGPVPGVLAELAATTISPASAPAVVRPTPEDLPVAWNNLATLNFASLSAYRQGMPAEALQGLDQTLASIVDMDEAAAVFRLPH